MKTRCNNQNHQYFARYGGLDIGYDKRREIFENFLEDMGERPEGTSLDRKDGNRGYSKDNCRWATRAEQAQNSANTTMTWEKVREIRRLWAEGKLSQGQIGELFGVQRHSVSMIVTNKCWKDGQNT